MKKYKVRPTFECFDLSHIYSSHILIEEGLVDPPYHYGLVMNVPKYNIENLIFLVKRIYPDSYWSVMGIGGKASLDSHFGAVVLGGFIRVGFEDNVYYAKGELAKSNAQLVERAVRISKEAGYELAGSAEVRKLLDLR